MVLDRYEPRSVLGFFETLCSIPHGSGNTKAISDYCVNFAKERGLACHQDELNNVIIIKEAAPGYENAPALILQGHLDMVCAKDADCDLDMETEGLRLAVDGDRLYAKGTSLGGDDGIAIAMALAVLDDNSLPHPRIEALFTVDEETGMDGARGLDPAPLTGRTLLNIDSEEEGIFTVSCAGGLRVNCRFPAERVYREAILAELLIDGLCGGHSGVEIDKGRANANVLMGRLLHNLDKRIPFSIVSLSGGTADNAIARQCRACIALSFEDVNKLISAVSEMESVFRKEYRLSDPEARISVKTEPLRGMDVIDNDQGRRFINALISYPNGVQAMSGDIPGLVETSLNLGILALEGDSFCASFSVRSSVSSRKDMLKDSLSALTAAFGGKVEFAGEYPAWEYKADSPLRDRMREIYLRQYGKEPQIVAIHAGLECGLLADKLPGLDSVSFGPDMQDIHTSKESMSISSVERVWKFLLEVLKESK